MEALAGDDKERICIVGGLAHPELAVSIAKELGTDLEEVNAKLHPNGEIYSRYENSIRGKHVIIIQSHVKNNEITVNDALMQQLLLVDAARSSSAREITAVTPYMAYTRQDHKDKGREPIGARVVIDQLATSGADRIVAVDMHASQTQGLFRGPFDHLTAQPVLREAVWEEVIEHAGYDKSDCMVIAPDAGAAKMAKRHSKRLGTALMFMDKTRDIDNNQKITREAKAPEADGRVCLIFDDMIDTAGTLVTAAEVLKNSGAKAVYAAATHGFFSDPAFDRINGSPLDKVFITDTFPMATAETELGDRLQVVSIAPKIGEALIQILTNGSVSQVFDREN